MELSVMDSSFFDFTHSRRRQFLRLLSALEFLNWEVAYRKKEEQPSRLLLSKNVLCYIETELNSAPMRCIAATIFFVVFSPGNAAPLLYCLILLSLIPAY